MLVLMILKNLLQKHIARDFFMPLKIYLDI